MNFIHENKVNKISEWNLLHDIQNHYKRTENFNIYYSPIIHVWMNRRKDRVESVLD